MNTLISLSGLLLGIFILFLLFLLLRQAILWYFRINEHIELLEQIRDRLPVIQEQDEVESQP